MHLCRFLLRLRPAEILCGGGGVFKSAPMTLPRTPWIKRQLRVNLVILGVILLFVIWKTFFP